MYVLRDTHNCTFLSSITGNGIITDHNFKNAIVVNDLNKAKTLLNYIDDDDYVIEEIDFKVIYSREEEY